MLYYVYTSSIRHGHIFAIDTFLPDFKFVVQKRFDIEIHSSKFYNFIMIYVAVL